MNNITRRSAIRAIGLGAPAAQFVAEKVKSDMLLNGGIANIGAPNAAPSVEDPAATKFSNFGQWFKDVGHEAIKEEARWIAGFDADIIDMRLPMATKVRMQRARNLERVMEKGQGWFAKQLKRHGAVKCWA